MGRDDEHDDGAADDVTRPADAGSDITSNVDAITRRTDQPAHHIQHHDIEYPNHGPTSIKDGFF